MPWSAQLENYYNSFGNGYVPYFSVIGADYEYLYGSNNVSGAINAAEAAMENITVYPPPASPAGIIDYPGVILSWQPPATALPVTGYHILRDGIQIGSTNSNSLSYLDFPGDGDYIYTIRTQYPQEESNDSDPVYINLINIIGDVDSNGETGAYDVSMVLHYITGIEPDALPFPWAAWRLERADIDGNNQIEALDAAILLQYVVGIIPEF